MRFERRERTELLDGWLPSNVYYGIDRLKSFSAVSPLAHLNSFF